MKPVCVPCRRFFRCVKAGFYFIEGKPKPGAPMPAPPGNEAPDQWEPYKIWSGDQWMCHGCGAVILSGFGSVPVAQNYEPDFDHYRRSLNADQLQVNDC